MKVKIHGDQILSALGFLGILGLGFFSPITRSSFSQDARELSLRFEKQNSQIEKQANPLNEESWKPLKPAAHATREFLSHQSKIETTD